MVNSDLLQKNKKNKKEGDAGAGREGGVELGRFDFLECE